MKRLLFLSLLCAACGTKLPIGPGTGGGPGGGGGREQPAAPPVLDVTVFAAAGAGATRLLADVANARLELDPTQRDALTALGECADLVSYCYAPGAYSLGDCFDRSRSCLTQTPWTEAPCCPVTCKTAFAAEVATGASPRSALEKVLFREPDCFPGVREALESP